MIQTSSRVTASNAGAYDDDQPWEKRSAMWVRRIAKNGASRAKRERPRSPLILTGHGVSLRLEGGTLALRNGFTHYRQKQEPYRFFKGELAIPGRIILLDGSGSISFDVLAWLSEQRVSLIQINWKGEVLSFTSPTGYSGNPFWTKWQNETRDHPKKRMVFCISLIIKKIEASLKSAHIEHDSQTAVLDRVLMLCGKHPLAWQYPPRSEHIRGPVQTRHLPSFQEKGFHCVCVVHTVDQVLNIMIQDIWRSG